LKSIFLIGTSLLKNSVYNYNTYFISNYKTSNALPILAGRAGREPGVGRRETRLSCNTKCLRNDYVVLVIREGEVRPDKGKAFDP
jgi:hypothetical protein